MMFLPNYANYVILEDNQLSMSLLGKITYVEEEREEARREEEGEEKEEEGGGGGGEGGE